MKKLLSVFLAFAMLLSCAAGLAESAPQEELSLPAAGDIVNGFEVKEIRDFALVGGKLVLFEHQKTGGKVIWIANDDTNRAFQLSFSTRPLDDTGLPHVFEHATLFGSEKYPSSNVFFGISYQVYQTYLNAYTTDALTAFPMASLSEKQLLSMADYYVDSCFHPLIMKDDAVFKTQAWHYNLPDPDGELTYEGVVYSEMQGAMTLQRMAMENANKVTFPGAALSYCFGGIAEKIPDMTWEDVKSFHDKYYHPSNCLALLYGRIEDYAAFLALLDGTFSEYEKAEFSETEENYTPIAEPVVSKVAYPMAEGTDVTNQSEIYYYVLCPGMKGDLAQEYLIDHVCSLLNEKASVLQQSMKNAFPAATVSCGREVAAPDDAIVFTASGMNENDAEQFKALVDEAINDVAENGFPQDMVDSVMVTLNISTKLASESGNPVEGVMSSICYKYTITGNPFAYADEVESESRIAEENRQGLLKEACAAWLKDPVLYTLTTTYPAPGEKEKADAALRDKLAEIKAGMSQEELEAIVAETNAEPAENDADELLARIRTVTVESLPEEVRIYPVSDTTDDTGVRHIDVTAGVDGIGKAQLLLDAAALPQEDIHWMRLYTRMLGQLDTDQHTKEELDALIGRYLYEMVTGVQLVDLTDSVHPYMVAEWIALDEDLSAGYDLMEELLFHTKFDDIQKLSDQVESQITTVRRTINQSSYNILLYRGMADHSPLFRYYEYLNYMSYYDFLLQLKEQLAEKPEEVTEHFRNLQAFFANNAGAVAAFAGNEKSIELNRPLADAFFAKLGHEEREAAVYDLPVPAKREALIIDGNIQHNCFVGTMDDMELEEPDAGLDAVCQLVGDKILMPVLRDQMGVYTPFASAEDNGSLFVLTYEDPNLKDTFDVFAALKDQIGQIEVNQDTLDGYIMAAYAELAKPAGELTGAVKVFDLVLRGKAQDKVLESMRQLKAVTPEKVKADAELFGKAWENGYRGTAGSAAAIHDAEDLFDVILNPFNTQAVEAGDFTDAPEDYEFYAGVRFAVENNLMKPVSETEFGAENPATAAELLEGLSMLLVQSPMSATELRDLLAGAGYMDPSLDVNAELTEQLLCDILNPIGAEMTTDTPDRVMPRGELADLLMQFYGE